MMSSRQATLESNARSRDWGDGAGLSSIGTDRVNAPRQVLSYSRFQGTARMFVLCALTLSNAELTTRRLRS